MNEPFDMKRRCDIKGCRNFAFVRIYNSKKHAFTYVCYEHDHRKKVASISLTNIRAIS